MIDTKPADILTISDKASIIAICLTMVGWEMRVV